MQAVRSVPVFRSILVNYLFTDSLHYSETLAGRVPLFRTNKIGNGPELDAIGAFAGSPAFQATLIATGTPAATHASTRARLSKQAT